MLVLQQQSTARQMRGHVVVAFEKIPDRFQFFVGEDDDRGMSKRTESTDEVNIGLVRLLSKLISYRSEEHTSELQSLMRISYAVFCLKKKKMTYHDKPTKHKQ